MVVSAKPLAGFCAITVAFLAGGCSYSSPAAKVHPPFVPPTHRTVTAAVLPPSPPIDSGPAILPVAPVLQGLFQFSEERVAAEALIQQAYLHFQRGRSYYQVSDAHNARREFDTAVDLIFAASSQDPNDRQEFSHKLEEMVDSIHRFDLAGLGAADNTEEYRFQQAPLEDILKMTFPVDPRLKAKVREQVAATASQLPLTVNDTVLAYITYFANRGHRTIVNAIERSGRYRPMIQRILDEEGLPQELIHLAQAESGFYPRAISRMAAGGMWQFVKDRGNQYGLRQTPYSDDRMDPEKATRAAAHHLHDLYTEFGDWYLALAAYNCGPMVVESAVSRTGYADFWELRNRGVLPAETTNYVPIILAMTIMEKNASEYGLEGIQMDPPLEYDTVETGTKTSMALVSDITETPLPELAELNPSILHGMIPTDYIVHVPKGAGTLLVAGLETVPPEHRDAWRVHRLAPGETVAEVGKRYGIPMNSLVAANNLQAREASEGDRLLIPAALRPDPVAAKKPVKPTTGVHHTTTPPTASSSKPKAPAAPQPKTNSKSAPKTPAKKPVIVAQSKAQ